MPFSRQIADEYGLLIPWRAVCFRFWRNGAAPLYMGYLATADSFLMVSCDTA